MWDWTRAYFESCSCIIRPMLEELFARDFGQRRQRGHHMGSLLPKVAVEVNHSDKGTKLSQGLRRSNVEDAFDLLRPRLQSINSYKMSHPLHFLDTPMALGWVDSVSIRFQLAQNDSELLDVFVPRLRENSNIINESFDEVIELLLQDFFQGSLRPIGTLRASHTQSLATILSKRGNQNAIPRTLFIQLVAVVTESEVNHGHKSPVVVATQHVL
mmetsp:Transcript_846/g.1633  ORF Transcript_846/g.1633 Transcript_846/m.1633 type:complete len:214 (+) Transcript_846:271-912(+)